MKTTKLILLSLFMVLLVDGIAQGILIPILSNTLIRPGSHVLIASGSAHYRNMLYGLILAVFFVCWFIGAPMVSSYSDQVGRKKCLILCLAGTCVGFVLTGLAFVFHSLTLIFLGRVIDGLTAGSQAVAQAAVIDISTEDQRARYIGYMILAVTIGMIVGPLLGGVFFLSSSVSLSHPAWPLYIAGFLSLLNLVLLQCCYHESAPDASATGGGLLSAVTALCRAFSSKQVLPLLLVFLLAMMGWTSYQFFATSYLAQVYQLHGLTNSIFFGAIGVGACFGFSNVGFFEKRFGQRPVVVVTISFTVLAVLILLTAVVHSVYFAWFAAVLGSAALAQGYSFMMKLFSSLAKDSEQGWIMGVVSSVAAMAAAIAIFLSGPLTSLGLVAPLWVDVIFILLAMLMLRAIVLFKADNLKQ